MGFDLSNHFPKIRESIEIPIPKVGAHLGVWRFIPSHFLTLPHSQEHEMWLPSFIIVPHLYKLLPWSWAQG
jgi:hypothetical protein